MKIKVLLDNNTYIDQYYFGEPAVSYYIEIDDRKILFDTGYSDILIKNANAMGIDLNSVTDIVLSHGHNDHTNGLVHLKEEIDLSKIRLVSHPLCFQPKSEGTENIGSPYSAQEISKMCNYVPATKPYRISDNCVFLGEVPAFNDFEKRRKMGTTVIDGKTADDLVFDDSALVCNTKEGIFIITGCSHSGICNIVEYSKQVCNCGRVAGVLGGFHLFDCDCRLSDTIQYLKNTLSGTLYPCHCVSLQAKAEMMKYVDVKEVGVGLSIEL